jgi:3-phenylpropionate/cinnamic acid dioxygenase small subunit
VTLTAPQAVQRLQDRVAIAEVLYTFARACDDLDFATLAACFAEDCRWDYGPGAGPAVVGRANVEAFVTEAFSRKHVEDGGVQVRIRRTSHHVSNILVDFEDDDCARSEAYVFTWHEMADGSAGLVWGRWRDRFVREHDTWRIAERRMFVAATENYYAIGYPLWDSDGTT